MMESEVKDSYVTVDIPLEEPVLFKDKGVDTAAIFEGTAKIARLCASFCPNAVNMKGQTFHG